MKPGRSRKTHLTQRDLQVMEHLVVRRAETLTALHAGFFAGLSRKRALNRLGELAGDGYLQRVTLAVPDELGCTPREQSVYTLGPKARVALELRSLSSEHFRFRRWNPILRDSSIPHQLATNRVVDLLRADQVPEHLLPPADNKDAMRHKPDAIWERPGATEAEAGTVLLEVDLGHYSRERILGKLRAFAARPGATAMLLVVPDAERVAQLRRWIGEDRALSSRRDFNILSFDELLADAPYFADRYGSHPLHDHHGPEHWKGKDMRGSG